MKNIQGQKFNRLTVVKYVGSDKQHHARWLCNCECGRQTIVTTNGLTSGHTKSCGCLFIETSINKIKKLDSNGQNNPNYRHGDADARLYKIWCDMKSRCSNPNNQRYQFYGMRGIKVCDEWNKSYKVFKEWALANGYVDIDGVKKDKLTIDRIDNDKNYCPENCRFITYSENSTKRNYEYWNRMHANQSGSSGATA